MLISGERASADGLCPSPPPASLSPDEYPELVAITPYAAALDPSEELERGLDILIAGLESVLARDGRAD